VKSAARFSTPGVLSPRSAAPAALLVELAELGVLTALLELLDAPLEHALTSAASAIAAPALMTAARRL